MMLSVWGHVHSVFLLASVVKLSEEDQAPVRPPVACPIAEAHVMTFYCYFVVITLS